MDLKKLRRTDYHVAWICPVSDLEVLPSRLMFDKEHDTPDYDISYDKNIYTCGEMVGHNVVLASCPPGLTGNVNAGHVASPMFNTFPNIYMAVLVGIGGGVPHPIPLEDPAEDIHLGDVVVGWPGDGGPACVYYDFGRYHTDGEFETRGIIDKPHRVLLNALGKLASDHDVDRSTFNEHRKKLLNSKHRRKFMFPGSNKDQLFQTTYSHCGRYGDECVGCDAARLVIRPQRTEKDLDDFIFHRSKIASGNAVIQDGRRRDQISELCGGVRCIETEAAGIDPSSPCLVIRGISDYADSHKSDKWRSYAAGNAAIFARELLSKVPPAIVNEMGGLPAPFMLPFSRNLNFVGRSRPLQTLEKHVSQNDSQKLAVWGLGGCGKTALLLEFAYRLRDQQPNRAVFWVPAINGRTFEQAYRDIGKALGIPEVLDRHMGNEHNIKTLVREKLSNDDSDPWLIIVDNADDAHVLLDSLSPSEDIRLVDYLPRCRNGSIIFTTRNKKVAVDLAGSHVLELEQIDEVEGKEFLEKRVLNKTLLECDACIISKFLEMLTYLPLAIVQAVAYINKNGVSLTEYIRLFNLNEEANAELLHEEFQDQTRYQDANNAVATTWNISFNKIRGDDNLASYYLGLMACVKRENIPASLLLVGSLPQSGKQKALGTLKAYAFISTRARQHEQEESYDIHRLVQTATEEWLKASGEWEETLNQTMRQLRELVGLADYNNIPTCGTYLPHIVHAVNLAGQWNTDTDKRIQLLMGTASFQQRDHARAESILREVIPLMEEGLGKGHPDTLDAVTFLAAAINSQGRYEEAEDLTRRTLKLAKKVLRKECPVLSMMTIELSRSLFFQERYAEAEKIRRKIIRKEESLYGKEHPIIIVRMSYLGKTLLRQGKHSEAEETLRDTLREQGEYSEAEEMFRKALELAKRAPPEYFTTVDLMDDLCDVLDRQGKYDRALEEQLYEVQQLRGEEYPDTPRDSLSENDEEHSETSHHSFSESDDEYSDIPHNSLSKNDKQQVTSYVRKKKQRDSNTKRKHTSKQASSDKRSTARKMLNYFLT
ncbi:kinesin light chain [Hypomontagnella monticulosa]|nr:kinesin light chain [Hypomontagnella monticulosa]